MVLAFTLPTATGLASDTDVAADFVLYRDAAARWISGGSSYNPGQIAGPYVITHGSDFPNGEALLRLAGSLLAEQQDEWLTADRRYLPQASLYRLPSGDPNPTLGDLLKEGAAV